MCYYHLFIPSRCIMHIVGKVEEPIPIRDTGSVGPQIQRIKLPEQRENKNK